jgi:hypothetical protein
MQFSTVGEVATQLGVRPAQISQLFYERKLSGEQCPIVGGRRIIPPDYVPVIEMVLRRKGIAVRSS